MLTGAAAVAGLHVWLAALSVAASVSGIIPAPLQDSPDFIRGPSVADLFASNEELALGGQICSQSALQNRTAVSSLLSIAPSGVCSPANGASHLVVQSELAIKQLASCKIFNGSLVILDNPKLLGNAMNIPQLQVIDGFYVCRTVNLATLQLPMLKWARSIMIYSAGGLQYVTVPYLQVIEATLLIDCLRSTRVALAAPQLSQVGIFSLKNVMLTKDYTSLPSLTTIRKILILNASTTGGAMTALTEISGTLLYNLPFGQSLPSEMGDQAAFLAPSPNCTASNPACIFAMVNNMALCDVAGQSRLFDAFRYRVSRVMLNGNASSGTGANHNATTWICGFVENPSLCAWYIVLSNNAFESIDACATRYSAPPALLRNISMSADLVTGAVTVTAIAPYPEGHPTHAYELLALNRRAGNTVVLDTVIFPTTDDPFIWALLRHPIRLYGVVPEVNSDIVLFTRSFYSSDVYADSPQMLLMPPAVNKSAQTDGQAASFVGSPTGIATIVGICALVIVAAIAIAVFLYRRRRGLKMYDRLSPTTLTTFYGTQSCAVARDGDYVTRSQLMCPSYDESMAQVVRDGASTSAECRDGPFLPERPPPVVPTSARPNRRGCTSDIEEGELLPNGDLLVKAECASAAQDVPLRVLRTLPDQPATAATPSSSQSQRETRA